MSGRTYWDLKGILSEIRSNYNCFDEKEEPYYRALSEAIRLMSAQSGRLTDDDFETIRIHLNAYKEKLCNQQRWGEAEEYQRIIDRFMAFASAQPKIEGRKEESTQNVPKEDLISRKAAIDAIGEKSDEIYKTKQKGATYPHNDFFQGMAYAEGVIKQLPSAQPERTEERTKTNACDCISRQAAIDAIDKEYRCTDHSDDWDGLKTAMLIIENLPSAQPEPRWIPCSERLPEVNGDYLVTGRQGAVNKRKYEDGRWYGNWAVLAWMELPAPYKEDTE